MNQIKIRRTFPRNRFYVKILLDWKESVDDRNFRSLLCRALINLRAYPLDIATFTDLKNIRGIGDQIARKLEEAWNVFCSQNLAVPNLRQINQMKKGEFLQFLNRSNSLQQKSRLHRNMKALSADSLSKKVTLENNTNSSSLTVNEPFYGEVIQTSNSLNVNVMIILIIDNRESANTKKFQQMCSLFQKKGIFYEMRSLSVGDYLWIMRKCDGTEMVLDNIVERKTLDDLWSSIMQKRYEEQKQRLVSVGIPNIIYIIEGFMISEPALEQALVSTHIENRFLVYRTNDIEHTSLVLSKIAERLIRKAISQEFMGMSFEKFQKMSKKTPCRNVKDVFLRQLIVCPHISIQKASLIVDRFPSFAALAVFYASIPQEQRAKALSEQFLIITKTASVNMAKFYSEV